MTVIVLDKELVYKEIQNQIKQYKGPIEFGVVKADGVINVYTDRGYGMRFAITAEGQPYTWAEEFLKLEKQDSESYGKFIFDAILRNSERNGVKVNLPARKKILGAKQMRRLRVIWPDMNDVEITKYVIYAAVTGQTCRECGIGYMECEFDSYGEYHSCINCGHGYTVR